MVRSKIFFIVFILLISFASLVSSGMRVPLHLDGSAVCGHLHADYDFLLPAVKKDAHHNYGDPEKIVVAFNELPGLLPQDDILSSFDYALSFSGRAPPA